MINHFFINLMNFYTLTFYVFSSVQRPPHIIKLILEEQTSVRLLRALLGTNGLGNERQYVSLKSSKENNSYVMSTNDFVACNTDLYIQMYCVPHTFVRNVCGLYLAIGLSAMHLSVYNKVVNNSVNTQRALYIKLCIVAVV